MSRKRDWAKLDQDWYTDEVLVAIADIEPVALPLWPVLVAMSYCKSDCESNPDGIISTSPVTLGNIVRADPKSVRKALELMQEGEMVDVAQAKLGTIKIRLCKFREWQSPKGSPSGRHVQRREELKSVTGENGPWVYVARSIDTPEFIKIGFSKSPYDRVTYLRDPNGGKVELLGTIPGSEALEKRLLRECEDSKVVGEWFRASETVEACVQNHFAGISCFVGQPSGSVGQTSGTDKIRGDKNKTILSERASHPTSDLADIKTVFEHWTKISWNGIGPRPKLSDKRKQRIRSRLKEGWTVADLCTSLDGYAKDPFWNGTQDGKPKLELAYRIGSTEEIERGLQLANKNRTLNTTQRHTEAELDAYIAKAQAGAK